MVKRVKKGNLGVVWEKGEGFGVRMRRVEAPGVGRRLLEASWGGVLRGVEKAADLGEGEIREGEPWVSALWRREMRERFGVDESTLIVEELGIIGRDIRGLVDRETGRLRRLDELDEGLARNVRKVRVRERRGGELEYEYELEDRGKALERMERIMGLLGGGGPVGVEEGAGGFEERLRKARDRVERMRGLLGREVEEGEVEEG